MCIRDRCFNCSEFTDYGVPLAHVGNANGKYDGNYGSKAFKMCIRDSKCAGGFLP